MISVIIRSHNDVGLIRRTVEALLGQRGCGEVELLSFDDSSTDGTAEALAQYPQLRRFAPDGLPYNPPRTLNRAVREARGELVVFNNSDAVPLSDDYLARLTAPLGDPAVGAVFGNQLPRPDAWPFVRRDHLRTFGDTGLAAEWPHFFSLVSSAARRELLTAEPFNPAMQYSEDVEWSERVRRRGLRIVYAPEARVEHSHNYAPAELRRRFYQEGRADFQMFPGPVDRWPVWRRMAMEIWRDCRFQAAGGQWRSIPDGIAYRIAQHTAAWRGRRDAAREAAAGTGEGAR